MSLMNFVAEEVKEKIQDNEVKSLEIKENELAVLIDKFIKFGMTKEQATAEAQMQIYKPKPMPKIELEKTNTNSGKRIKINFFVNEDELKQISEKYKIINQMDELRIAGSDMSNFINALLGRKE